MLIRLLQPTTFESDYVSLIYFEKKRTKNSAILGKVGIDCRKLITYMRQGCNRKPHAERSPQGEHRTGEDCKRSDPFTPGGK